MSQPVNYAPLPLDLALLAPGLATLGLAPSPQQLCQLEMYLQGLRAANARMNLVAASTLADAAHRHVLDCAQLVPWLPAAPTTVLDVGSGAGLPGLVLAVLAPQHRYVLAEKVGKKARFLQETAVALGVTGRVEVFARQVQELAPRRFGVIAARAYAPLERLLASTENLLAPAGMWLLLKGEAAESEIAASARAQRMTVRRGRSITSAQGVILQLIPSSTGNGYNL